MCLGVTSATISQDRSSYSLRGDVSGRATRTGDPLLYDLHTITDQSEGTHTHARTNGRTGEQTNDHGPRCISRPRPAEPDQESEGRNPEELGPSQFREEQNCTAVLDSSPRAVGMSMSGSRRGPLGRMPAPWRSPHPSGDHLETMPLRAGFWLPSLYLSFTFQLLPDNQKALGCCDLEFVWSHSIGKESSPHSYSRRANSIFREGWNEIEGRCCHPSILSKGNSLSEGRKFRRFAGIHLVHVNIPSQIYFYI